jgi:hypothetical protein
MEAPPAAQRPWRPSQLVTLLSDYGLDDPYVGIVKGVLQRESSALRAVIDLTHGIPPGDVAAAAFLLERSWFHFPSGTVHVAVVDPGVGSARELLLVEARGQALVAPDNGLLWPLLASEPGALVLRADERAPRAGASHTFHGRDRLAPLAARLCDGTPPAALGAPCADPVRLELPRVEQDAAGDVLAEVVHVDRFGNLITNVPGELLARGRGPDWRAEWQCCVGGERFALVRTYAEARPGDPVALVDAYERLEIALREDSAARVLALGRGTRVRFQQRKRSGA